MARYIDADALSYRIEKRIDSVTDFSFAEGLSEAIVEIGLSPTLSPDEVRGVGEWVDKGVRAWSCSCCGTPLNHIRQFASFEKNELPNYCPNCGARMKGAKDNASP